MALPVLLAPPDLPVPRVLPVQLDLPDPLVLLVPQAPTVQPDLPDPPALPVPRALLALPDLPDPPGLPALPVRPTPPPRSPPCKPVPA